MDPRVIAEIYWGGLAGDTSVLINRFTISQATGHDIEELSVRKWAVDFSLGCNG